jgi:hypothetical protein
MDGVDLFPWVTQRRRIVILKEDNKEEVAWESVKIRTSREGIEGHRTPEENDAVRRREVFMRHHTQRMDISQMLDLNPTSMSGKGGGVRDESGMIDRRQEERDEGQWQAPSCVCITPCPCYMMARNYPTKCDLPNGHLSTQLPRDKLKHLQAGGRVLVLEVHWDNHT